MYNQYEHINKINIDPKQIEVAFISATRNDQKNDKSLCRGEFLEMIIRIAHIRFRKQFEKTPRKSMISPLTNNQNFLKNIQNAAANYSG